MISYCRICGAELQSKVKRTLCDCVECRKKAKAENDKRYRTTEKGQKTRRKNRHTEKAIATRKAYEQTEKYKKSKSERAKKYRQSEKVQMLDRVRKLRYYYRKYSNIKEAGKDFISYEDFEKLWNTDKCYYCGCEVKDRQKTIDHKTPISRGGTNAVENLCICCQKCNSRKRNKTETEFKKNTSKRC